MDILMPRTWMLSILFLIWEFRLLNNSRHLWWLPLIFAFWANLHIQFVDGLLFLGVAYLAAVFEKKPAKELLAVLVASALATLANPYGYKVYVVVFSVRDSARADAADQRASALRILELKRLVRFHVGRVGRV